jgi:hypothetical protein
MATQYRARITDAELASGLRSSGPALPPPTAPPATWRNSPTASTPHVGQPAALAVIVGTGYGYGYGYGYQRPDGILVIPIGAPTHKPGYEDSFNRRTFVLRIIVLSRSAAVRRSRSRADELAGASNGPH